MDRRKEPGLVDDLTDELSERGVLRPSPRFEEFPVVQTDSRAKTGVGKVENVPK